jgi:hypothetical protein
MRAGLPLGLLAAALGCSSTSFTGGTTGGAASTSSGGGSSGGGTTGAGTTGGGSTGGGDAGTNPKLGLACAVSSGEQLGGRNDPCVPFGLACANGSADPKTGTYTGECELPGELEACEKPWGCAQTPVPYTCVTGLGGGGLCAQGCATVRDCRDVVDACIPLFEAGQSYCYPNVCGPGSNDYYNVFNSGVSTGNVPNGAAWYGACTVELGQDGGGTCLPYPSPQGALGLCAPTGSAVTGAACTTDRPVDGGLFCTPGDFCAPDAGDLGTCLPTCGDPTTALPDAGPPDGGPVCAAGETCTSFPFQVCEAVCTPGTPTCFGVCRS